MINRPSPTSLLAQAEVSNFTEYDTGSADSTDSAEMLLARERETRWKHDQLMLDVLDARSVKVNQFDPSRSAAIFIEPDVPGHQRVNLAELSRAAPRGFADQVRQTLPRRRNPAME